MPARLVEEPLGIACVFSDGSRAEFCLDGLPEPRLARDLLVGLVELIHPHGSVDAQGSVQHYVLAIRNMVRVLAERGFAGGAGQLRRAKLIEYWMGASGGQEACTRRMLQGFDQATGGLAGSVRELVAGRAYNPQPNHRALPPYPEAEWTQLTQACQSIAETAFAAHRHALADAARGQDPRSGGWSLRNLRWLLARSGPLGTSAFARQLGCSAQTIRQRGGFYQASAELFPSLDTVIAYRLLFGIGSGIVPDGIDDLVTDDLDWAGDATILLSYVKGRTATESLTLPRRAVRLLEQWLGHSSLLRSSADLALRRRLWLSTGKVGTGTIIDPTGRHNLRRWVARHGLAGQDGRPLKLHRSRIRTTHQSMRAKATWTGNPRATVDPNHSAQVEGDHYLTAATPAQQHAVEAIVEDAQHDLLRRAHPPAVLADQDAAALAQDYPQLVAGLGMDQGALAELVGGARDVFVAACADQLAGLHGPRGKPCPGPPVGLFAVPAGGVRAPARGQPAAVAGVLLPAVAAAARRPVHGRLRPVCHPGPPGPGLLRPCGAGPGGWPGQRRRRRAAASPRGAHHMSAMRTQAAAGAGTDAVAGPSPFAGVNVCDVAGFQLQPGTRGPVFEDDIWDFTGVVELPAHLPPCQRRPDFAAIANPRWRVVAKELILALLAPRHPAVTVLPRAYRTPLHLNTCQGRLQELTRWLNWLTEHDIASLEAVTDEHCEAYLAHRRHARDEHGRLLGDRGPGTRRAAVLAILELNNYRELFTTDRYPTGLRPWAGASASAVAEFTKSAENKTLPVPQHLLQPMLAAALYLTGTLGPQLVDLARRVRQSDRSHQARSQLTATRRLPRRQLIAVLGRHAQLGDPLPLLPEHFVRSRLTAGWQPHDPLLRVNLDALARAVGVTQFQHQWIPALRDLLQATLAQVGLQAPWARDAEQVPRADGHDQVPWTLPLHAEEVRALAGVVRTACIIVTAAVAGMRACELMELKVGCRRPSQELAPGLVRYRLAGTLIKGQPLGGVQDEWVVIEPVARAVELAEQLLHNPQAGEALFGRFAFTVRYQWFRAWVNGPAGQRLGLPPIPQDQVSLRALRRTLALELAYTHTLPRILAGQSTHWPGSDGSTARLSAPDLTNVAPNRALSGRRLMDRV